ncbi:MAG: PASTA domain-containing protein, partial [Bacteroidales bacterium]
SSFRVYRQEPNPIDRQQQLRAGSTVDIYYRSADLFDFEAYQQELFTEPVPSLLGKSPQEVEQILEGSRLKLGEEIFEDNVSPEDARVYMQTPEYSEDARVENGTRINVIYRAR